jgi:hypothetical protein
MFARSALSRTASAVVLAALKTFAGQIRRPLGLVHNSLLIFRLVYRKTTLFHLA